MANETNLQRIQGLFQTKYLDKMEPGFKLAFKNFAIMNLDHDIVTDTFNYPIKTQNSSDVIVVDEVNADNEIPESEQVGVKQVEGKLPGTVGQLRFADYLFKNSTNEDIFKRGVYFIYKDYMFNTFRKREGLFFYGSDYLPSVTFSTAQSTTFTKNGTDFALNAPEIAVQISGSDYSYTVLNEKLRNNIQLRNYDTGDILASVYCLVDFDEESTDIRLERIDGTADPVNGTRYQIIPRFETSRSILGLQQHIIGTGNIYNFNIANRGLWKGAAYDVGGSILATNVRQRLNAFVEQYRSNSSGMMAGDITMYVPNKLLALLNDANDNNKTIQVRPSDMSVTDKTGAKTFDVYFADTNIMIKPHSYLKNNTAFIVPKSDACVFTGVGDTSFQTSSSKLLMFPSIDEFTSTQNRAAKFINFTTGTAFGFPNLREYGIMHNFTL